MPRWGRPGLGAALVTALVGLCACGHTAPGGGMTLAAAEATAPAATAFASSTLAAVDRAAAQAASALAQAPSVAAPDGMVTTNSLAGWHVVVGTGGTGPSIVAGAASRPGPALNLPGDSSYVWYDPGVGVTSFAFDVWTDGLMDFFFGANDSGAGQMFRVETRGGSNYTGFAHTASWTAWDCPGTGTDDEPPGNWLHVTVALRGGSVTATVTWPGTSEAFSFATAIDGCQTGVTASFAAYQPQGTAFGFQGDALGADTNSLIANLQ